MISAQGLLELLTCTFMRHMFPFKSHPQLSHFSVVMMPNRIWKASVGYESQSE